MQKTRASALLALALAAGGCAAPPKGPVPVPDPRGISGSNREWWDVYSVEFQGDRKIRTKAGYLYRKFGPEDRQGKYWVLDLGMRELGFLLADYQAFLIVEPRPPMIKRVSQPVGTTDLNGGVKRILQVPGTVELEKALPRNESAPALSTSTR